MPLPLLEQGQRADRNPQCHRHPSRTPQLGHDGLADLDRDAERVGGRRRGSGRGEERRERLALGALLLAAAAQRGPVADPQLLAAHPHLESLDRGRAAGRRAVAQRVVGVEIAAHALELRGEIGSADEGEAPGLLRERREGAAALRRRPGRVDVGDPPGLALGRRDGGAALRDARIRPLVGQELRLLLLRRVGADVREAIRSGVDRVDGHAAGVGALEQAAVVAEVGPATVVGDRREVHASADHEERHPSFERLDEREQVAAGAELELERELPLLLARGALGRIRVERDDAARNDRAPFERLERTVRRGGVGEPLVHAQRPGVEGDHHDLLAVAHRPAQEPAGVAHRLDAGEVAQLREVDVDHPGRRRRSFGNRRGRRRGALLRRRRGPSGRTRRRPVEAVRREVGQLDRAAVDEDREVLAREPAHRPPVAVLDHHVDARQLHRDRVAEGRGDLLLRHGDDGPEQRADRDQSKDRHALRGLALRFPRSTPWAHPRLPLPATRGRTAGDRPPDSNLAAGGSRPVVAAGGASGIL